MNAIENIVRQPADSLLGWFGLGKSGRGGNRQNADQAALRATRARLLDRIGNFFDSNDLAVTSANLQLAHRAFSGIDPNLEQQIALRSAQAGKITQHWLDTLVPSNRRDEEESDGRENLERLMVKLEADLDRFADSAKAAHTASATYGAELAQHASDLDQVKNTGTIVSDLARLAKVMLERTRKIEEDMRRSEGEATALRSSLAKAKRDAELDHLTGLPNRRAFETSLEQHYQQARMAGEALSVAFCDVDHFKQVNDLHGHDTGDRVLQTIAADLARISNDKCHVARHGGEEFVMLFHGQTPEQARQQLDAVRERLANRRFVNRKTDTPLGQITFSGGVADVFGHADLRSALAAADAALYQAKRGGRNRVELEQARTPVIGPDPSCIQA